MSTPTASPTEPSTPTQTTTTSLKPTEPPLDDLLQRQIYFNAKEFEARAPTPSSDRECQVVRGCRRGFEYQQSPPSPFSDRICSLLTTCSESEYAAVPATLSSDRQCKALTVCNASEFAVVPATRVSDRTCAPHSPECSAGLWERVQPSADEDRSCATCSVCADPSEFVAASCGFATDTVCVPVSLPCKDDEFQVEAPTPSSDRQCAALQVCSFPAEFESAKPTTTTDRACTTTASCTATQYLRAEETPSSDRDCADHSAECDALNEFESQTPTELLDRVCQSCLEFCPDGQYKSAACGRFTDTECKTVVRCDPDQFEQVAPTTTTDRVCEPRRLDCDPQSEFESKKRTPSSDHECAPATACTPATEFELSPLTEDADRVCRSVTGCGPNEYETMAPTKTSDRQCSATRRCAGGEWETTAPTASSDRGCESHSICVWASEYAAIPPTATSDRRCQALKECAGLPDQYVAARPTRSTDRACGRCTRVCPLEQYMASECGLYADARCLNCTIPPLDFFASTPCDPNSDAVLTACSPACDLQPGQYEAHACGGDADRLCATCRQCPSGTFQTSPCAPTADTNCTTLTTCDAATEYVPLPLSNSSNVESANGRLHPHLRTRSRPRCLRCIHCYSRSALRLPPRSACRYECEAPSGDTDRKCCQAAPLCDPSTEYAQVNLTSTTDRQCATRTVCVGGASSNRPCGRPPAVCPLLAAPEGCVPGVGVGSLTVRQQPASSKRTGDGPHTHACSLLLVAAH